MVQSHYAEVADHPDGEFHFHTGRFAAEQLGYDPALRAGLPESAVEAFAGVANPFEWGSRRPTHAGIGSVAWNRNDVGGR